MAKMTKSQARKRLNEAHQKLLKVYFGLPHTISLTQIQKIDDIIERALKRLK